MKLGIDHPALLLLLILAVFPFLAGVFRWRGLASLAFVPHDLPSTLLGHGLRVLAALAIAGTVFGLAGLHRREAFAWREGTGAHLVLLLDRSASMDNSFADRVPGRAEESKSAAAKRLLEEFAANRPHDRIAVAAFSTSPMLVLPMSDHAEAVAAAIAAIDRPGLAFTDVGRGLALALASFDDEAPPGSRALLLVSDGAAVIDRRTQAALREMVTRTPVSLYWLYLRSVSAKGPFDLPGAEGEGTPQSNPERHLHLFLSSLGVPYRAFEATNPEAVKSAIAEIDRLETRPLRYAERIPRRDLSRTAYAVALAATGLLLVAKLLERDLAATRGDTAPARSRIDKAYPA